MMIDDLTVQLRVGETPTVFSRSRSNKCRHFFHLHGDSRPPVELIM